MCFKTIIKLVTTSILMSKIPKFGVPVTDEEYARKREQEP